MSRQKSVQTRLLRLGQILRIFMEKEKVASSWLSKQFQTTPRTIQRDLLLLKEAGFPLHEIRKGHYEMAKDLVKNLEVFDDTELALVVALKNLVGQLGQPFRTAADGVLDRLYDCVTTMPVFVKIDESVSLDSRLLNRIVKAIREKRQVSFQYTAAHASHPVVLEPYRVVYFGGFWYLVGQDTKADILKRYALDKISDFRLLSTTYISVPENLDAILQGSANIWFAERNDLEVTVMVDSVCSDYFRRRKMHPSQEIREARSDGSVVVSFKVGQYEAVLNILKSWLPHIVIVEPDGLKKELLEDMKLWVQRQARIT